MKDKIWDVIIVGAGPAGSNAAVVLARSCRSVLLIDEGKQRNIKSHGMHNYLTRDGILPADYLAISAKELNHYKVNIVKARVISTRKLDKHGFEIVDNFDKKYLCRRLLLATGVTDNVPDIEGMAELWGHSVHHCPYCDGFECKDAHIGLYAKNINGYGMALTLRQLSDHITLYTDGSKYLKASQRTHLTSRNIAVITTPLQRLMQKDEKLAAILLKDGREIKCESLFLDHGFKVNNDLAQQLKCRCTNKGATVTNRKQQTSVLGVYVAGDASLDTHFVVVAAADGAKAAVAIHNDLLNLDNANFFENL